MTPFSLPIADHLSTVVASAVIAVLATYVALELAGRIHRAADRIGARLWTLAGSMAMGSGIWATHFVGMSAAVYPFRAAYETGMTLVSWLVAMLASAAFLTFAGRIRTTTPALVGFSLLAGGGAVLMHYVGARALVVSTDVVYDLRWTAAALATIVVGTAVALRASVRLRDLDGWAMVRRQLAAASMYGLALGCMHYMAMASTEYATGTICLSRDGLEVGALGDIVGFATITFLGLVLLMTTLDRRADVRARRLDRSLDRAREELHHVTFNDQVTGLPNRLVFQDRLRQAIARCDRSGDSVAVLFVDLDGFKAVDHSWNNTAGAETLRRVATALVNEARASDTVSVVGDDQFLVMMDGDGDLQLAVQVAERIAFVLRAIGRDGDDDGDDVIGVTASIGIAVYPADGTLASLVGAASRAAAEARVAGGNGYRFCEAATNVAIQARSALLADLRRAVERNQLTLHYQTKFDARSGALAGVEALLRWHHPSHGLVGPDVFIPLAEQFGVIGDLGAWVIDAVCRQMAVWAADAVRVPVAINLSVRQLRDVGLTDLISAALARNDIDPAMLTCEITESVTMDDPQATLAVLARLRELGVRLSIDDFGTGHSSLSYLRTLPVAQLKVDRSFVGDLASTDTRSIVRAIVDLGHALRLEVVAEGVETEEQRRTLQAMGCDQLQGFLLGRPVPAEQLALRSIEPTASGVVAGSPAGEPLLATA